MRNRLPQLDGVRGIAALMVVVAHYVVKQVRTTPGTWQAYALRPFSTLWSGVDLFFVLSGFLIVGILLDNREAPNYFRAFFARRIARIFPLYYAWLLAFLVLAALLAGTSRFGFLFDDALPAWSYAAFLQNFVMAARDTHGANFLGITWSLAVEEQFYVFAPALVLLLPRRVLGWLFAAAIAAAPLLRHGHGYLYGYMLPYCRMDALAAGGLLAVLVRSHGFVEGVTRHKRAVLAAFAVLAANAGLASWRPVFGEQQIYSVFAALYFTFVLIAFAGVWPALNLVLTSRVLVWFGTVSYGIYMFHQGASGFLHGLVFCHAPQITSWTEAGVTLLSFVATLGLAAVSFRFFESPIQRFGHAVRYQRSVGYEEVNSRLARP